MKKISTGNRGPLHVLFKAITAILLINVWVQPAIADWRKELGTFRIGLVTGEDARGKLAKIEPFRLAIEEALGVKVEIFTAGKYRTLIDALASARIEYAIYSASAYATNWVLCECVEPIVLPKSSDGSERFHSVIISRPGGPADAGDLSRVKLAGLSPQSFAGNKFARFELNKAGIKLPEKLVFFDNGEIAVQKLMDKEIDGLIGWTSLSGQPEAGYGRGTLKYIGRKNGGSIKDYNIIWYSSAIYNRPHTVRKSLAGEAKTILRDLLVNMYNADPIAYDAIEPVFGGGFIAARHSQYSPVLEYIKSLGINNQDSGRGNKASTENTAENVSKDANSKVEN